MQIKFENISMPDGKLLRYAHTEGVEAPKAVVQFIHGFGEHCDSYAEIMKFFAKKNIASIIHDQRGHGVMPGVAPEERAVLLGLLPAYSLFTSDLKIIAQKARQIYGSLPLILYGHSMGGNIALNSFEGYSRVILESPWIRLYKTPSLITRIIAKVLGGISYKIAIDTKLVKNHISRDKEQVKKIEEDPLFHTRISLRLFGQVSAAGINALNSASRLNIPVFLLCASNDKIVCPKAIRELASKIPVEHLTFKEYEDAYHALRKDIIGKEVMSDVANYILNSLG